jgi:hypothetical protein
MLRPVLAEQLLALLNNDEDRLADLSQRFAETFDFADRISALYGLAMLLTDGLLDHCQQIVAVWLLFEECKAPAIADHPFYPVFQSLFETGLADPNFLSPQLHDILPCILQGVGLQAVGAQPLRALLGTNAAFPDFLTDFRPEPPVQTVADRVCPVLVLPRGGEPALSHSEVILQLLQDEAYWASFEPPFAHTCPDVAPVFRDEIAFVDAVAAPRFLCDDGAPVDSRLAIAALIGRAADGKLRPNEAESVVARLRGDASLAEEAQVPPAKLATLIESNPEIAKEVIVATIEKPAVADALLHVDVSAASVDVVKHVLLSRQAPERFLGDYVKIATAALSGIQNAPTRQRKARVFCKMMSFVIQSGSRLTRDIMLDLNAFCEDHKTKGVKEAQELNGILNSATYVK